LVLRHHRHHSHHRFSATTTSRSLSLLLALQIKKLSLQQCKTSNPALTMLLKRQQQKLQRHKPLLTPTAMNPT
jgi:spore coat protein CotF